MGLDPCHCVFPSVPRLSVVYVITCGSSVCSRVIQDTRELEKTTGSLILSCVYVKFPAVNNVYI